jgi:hypothetical protein
MKLTVHFLDVTRSDYLAPAGVCCRIGDDENRMTLLARNVTCPVCADIMKPRPPIASSPEAPQGTGPREYLRSAVNTAFVNAGKRPDLVDAIDQESGYSELYLALEDLAHCEFGAPSWDMRHEFERMMNAARAALAHARGEKTTL